MRNIVSISLPLAAVRFVDRQVKQRGFRSKSEYVRHLITLEQGMITEDDVLRFGQEARREHKAGKTKKLRSLRDLM